jgi:hypothetical protein
MDESSTTSDALDQADKDVLTYTVSDDALEAAAGRAGNEPSLGNCSYPYSYCRDCPE